MFFILWRIKNIKQREIQHERLSKCGPRNKVTPSVSQGQQRTGDFLVQRYHGCLADMCEVINCCILSVPYSRGYDYCASPLPLPPFSMPLSTLLFALHQMCNLSREWLGRRANEWLCALYFLYYRECEFCDEDNTHVATKPAKNDDQTELI